MPLGDFIAIACAAALFGVLVLAFVMERRTRPRRLERRRHRERIWP